MVKVTVWTVWKFKPTLEANKFAADLVDLYLHGTILKSTIFGSSTELVVCISASKLRESFVIQTGRTT